MTETMDDRWIETYTGKRFWPLTPRAEDVCIEDIAHALSLKCRFGGHCREFYSVAQHSVLVSQTVPREHSLAALLHDAAEAYLPDVCRPIKRSLAGFKELEAGVMKVVADRFGLSLPMSPEVSLVDSILLATEARDLMSQHFRWTGLTEEPLPARIMPWTAKMSEEQFLFRFDELRGMP